MTDQNTPKVQRLAAFPNNYEWGPVGSGSLAARYAPNAAPAEYEIKEEEHYAELWMGTHPTNPSKIYGSDQLLSAYLADKKALLGSAKDFKPPFDGKKAEEGHVPFLFKILCANQALPLQVHPNKELSEKLHKENPDQFQDKNHKPEIAVCLSDRFLGFAGIRSLEEVRSLLASTPELSKLPSDVQKAVEHLTGDIEHEGKLRAGFEAFISMEGAEVEEAVKAFCERVKKEGSKAFDNASAISEDDKERLAEATGILAEFNAGDGSIFVSLFFMNLMELKKGEGMYVGADGPHAWLKGDIVELMAISDNVLNVGFTPDKDDTKLVAKTMTATPQSPSSIKLASAKFDKGTKGRTTVYATPFEEFSIMRISGEETLEALDGPAIAIVTEGTVAISENGQKSGSPAEKGTVYFIGAGAKVDFSAGGEVWAAFYDGDKNPKLGKQ